MWTTPTPVLAELADDPEQLGNLGLGEGRGRLVHDQHSRVERERLGDLDHLLLGHGKVADPAPRVHPQVRATRTGPRARVLSARSSRTNGSRARGSRPMKMFWATVRCGIRFSS